MYTGFISKPILKFTIITSYILKRQRNQQPTTEIASLVPNV